ncbi:MAG TPA: hypothetical protein VGM92_01950, partial [Candidatus Kapabacteria bacterium]
MDRTTSHSRIFTARNGAVRIAAIYFCMSTLVCLQTVRAQVRFNSDERRIITIADERRDADSLLVYLASSDANIARRAAIGIGNIGDTSMREPLLRSLVHEGRDTVAEAEAFALGLLGPDAKTYHALIDDTKKHPTLERLKAIARTAPKADSASAAETLHQLAAEKKISAFTEADASMAFALRHETASGMWNDLDALADNDNPDIRWRAAYAFSRGADSLSLFEHRSTLNNLLLDQGSIEVRMFAAMAFGRWH